MKPGSVLVDVTMTRRAASDLQRQRPLRSRSKVDGIVHYCVANVPRAPSRSRPRIPPRHNTPVRRGDREPRGSRGSRDEPAAGAWSQRGRRKAHVPGRGGRARPCVHAARAGVDTGGFLARRGEEPCREGPVASDPLGARGGWVLGTARCLHGRARRTSADGCPLPRLGGRRLVAGPGLVLGREEPDHRVGDAGRETRRRPPPTEPARGSR